MGRTHSSARSQQRVPTAKVLLFGVCRSTHKGRDKRRDWWKAVVKGGGGTTAVFFSSKYRILGRHCDRCCERFIFPSRLFCVHDRINSISCFIFRGEGGGCVAVVVWVAVVVVGGGVREVRWMKQHSAGAQPWQLLIEGGQRVTGGIWWGWARMVADVLTDENGGGGVGWGCVVGEGRVVNDRAEEGYVVVRLWVTFFDGLGEGGG